MIDMCKGCPYYYEGCYNDGKCDYAFQRWVEEREEEEEMFAALYDDRYGKYE